MTHNSLEGLKIKRQVLPILFVVGMVLLSGIGWCEALFFWGTQSDGSGGSLSKPAEEIEVDYYEVLELPSGSDSTESQIKKQFRVLSKKYHPDLNPTEEARQKYLVIQRAYEVLSDRRRRKVYDMKGEAGLKAFETQEKGGGNDHHPLSNFFGFFGGGNNNTPQRGADVNIQVVVPLRDMYSGNTHTVHFSKQKLCRKCKGTGAASKSDLHTCGECDGTGTVVQNIRLGPGMVQRMQSACRKCNGKGKIIKRVCPVCHGHKVSRGKTILDVAVERGVSENHKITIDMEADESPDVLPGDVLLHIVSAPDERFERQPNQVDLAMTLVLTLSESLLGFSKRVVHLDGHDFQVSREDRVTPHLHKIVIKGEGMPHHNIPSEFGDLHITFHVEYGKKRIDSETKTQLSELLRDL